MAKLTEDVKLFTFISSPAPFFPISHNQLVGYSVLTSALCCNFGRVFDSDLPVDNTIRKLKHLTFKRINPKIKKFLVKKKVRGYHTPWRS